MRTGHVVLICRRVGLAGETRGWEVTEIITSSFFEEVSSLIFWDWLAKELTRPGYGVGVRSSVVSQQLPRSGPQLWNWARTAVSPEGWAWAPGTREPGNPSSVHIFLCESVLPGSVNP